VYANVARSLMSFAQKHINFGTVKLPYHAVVKTLLLTNESALPLLFKVFIMIYQFMHLYCNTGQQLILVGHDISKNCCPTNLKRSSFSPPALKALLIRF